MYKYLKDEGSFNKFPSPIKEVTQDEFLNATCHDKILDVEERQVIEEIDGYKQWLHSKIYYSFQHAYAIGQYNKDLNTNKYHYYRVGCEHKNATETKIGNCLTRWTCPDCGYETDIDSSD